MNTLKRATILVLCAGFVWLGGEVAHSGEAQGGGAPIDTLRDRFPSKVQGQDTPLDSLLSEYIDYVWRADTLPSSDPHDLSLEEWKDRFITPPLKANTRYRVITERMKIRVIGTVAHDTIYPDGRRTRGKDQPLLDTVWLGIDTTYVRYEEVK